MKKYLLIICLLFTGIAGHSQILITLLLGDKLNSDGLEFGLEGGVNSSTISGLETNTYANNWNLGFYFDIRVKNQWFVYTGVLVKSSLGVRNLTNSDLLKIGATEFNDLDGVQLDGDYSQVMTNFLIPVLAKYKFTNNIYAELGPQFGLINSAYVEFESKIGDIETSFKENNRDNLNRIDVGITVGAGYTLFNGNGWTFGAKYYYGFVDVYKDVSGTKNSSIFLKVNIPIGAAKKADKGTPKEG